MLWTVSRIGLNINLSIKLGLQCSLSLNLDFWSPVTSSGPRAPYNNPIGYGFIDEYGPQTLHPAYITSYVSLVLNNFKISLFTRTPNTSYFLGLWLTLNRWIAATHCICFNISSKLFIYLFCTVYINYVKKIFVPPLAYIIIRVRHLYYSETIRKRSQSYKILVRGRFSIHRGRCNNRHTIIFDNDTVTLILY